MLRKISQAVGSRKSSGPDLKPLHHSAGRAETYVQLANDLEAAGIPVDLSDRATCDHPCPAGDDGAEQRGAGTVVDAGMIWEGKKYEEYVTDKYGDLGELPAGFGTDWDSELAGSGAPPRGRIVVISTGKSDWERDHTDEKGSFAHQLNKLVESIDWSHVPKVEKVNKDFNKRGPISDYIASAAPLTSSSLAPPSLYSSSLISQADDPEDQTIFVFPDWKVVHEVENSRHGAKGLYETMLKGGISRGGAEFSDAKLKESVGRTRSWVLPYRAVVLLCSHKRRDKKCSIAAPRLRSALITCLSKYNVNVDETGTSSCAMTEPPLEDVAGGEAGRDAEVSKRIKAIDGVNGGDGGEVGIFNINHLGGHRYAGVMMVLFPSGAFVSYGRVTPQEIPRVVEETVLQGKIVPGLLRCGRGVERQGKNLLGW